MARARKRSLTERFLSLAEGLVSVALKLGLLVSVLTAGYLLYGVFSGGVAGYMSLAEADRERVFLNTVIASKACQISAAFVIVAIVIRFYSEDIVGYILAIAGAAGYFVGPNGLLGILGESGVQNNPIASIILNTFQIVSLMMFAPGVGLSVRSLVLGVLEGLVGYELEKSIVVTRGAETPLTQHRNVLNPKCWNMPYCRPFIKKMCPAWRSRKACWRIKAGCYCDETTILKALQIDSEGSAANVGVQPQRDSVSSAVKRKRCRTCPIYSLHQRRKYQILSPLAFPAVGIFFWSYFGEITGWVNRGLEATEYFMRSVSFSPEGLAENVYVGGGSETLVILLFVCWLAIMSLSYILRALEYCIFKLQI